MAAAGAADARGDEPRVRRALCARGALHVLVSSAVARVVDWRGRRRSRLSTRRRHRVVRESGARRQAVRDHDAAPRARRPHAGNPRPAVRGVRAAGARRRAHHVESASADGAVRTAGRRIVHAVPRVSRELRAVHDVAGRDFGVRSCRGCAGRGCGRDSVHPVLRLYPLLATRQLGLERLCVVVSLRDSVGTRTRARDPSLHRRVVRRKLLGAQRAQASLRVPRVARGRVGIGRRVGSRTADA